MKKDPPEPDSLEPQPIPDDPHKELMANLAEFLLSLIQAFLRIGYYTSDHPEAKKARLGLYENFQRLFTQEDELTFLVMDDSKGNKILIEGVLPETYDLNSVMLRGMAEMYTPKFAKFLDRKDLISLTLKNAMTQTEFTNFVDLMGEPLFVDTREKGDKERFSQTLKERGIFNISYIFKQELLAIERKILWRSRLALARLKKDFSAVPLYMDLDAEGMKKVRRQIIQDVARPIQTAEVIYPILMNSDLAETKEFKISEINEEMIACLSDELLFQISKQLLNEILRHEETKTPQAKSAELATQLTSSLNLREIKGTESILKGYLKHKLISFEHLPKTMQREIKAEQVANKFLRHSNAFLDQFEKIQDGEKYLQTARTLARIIPELVRRDRYKEILEIITRIDRHVMEKRHPKIIQNQEGQVILSTYAEQILEKIQKGGVLKALKGRFLTGEREIREAIAPILVKLRAGAVPHLLSLLRQSNDHLVRKHACDILAQIDPSAINLILDDLSKRKIATKSTVDIIRVLGEVQRDEWIQPFTKTLKGYLKHKSPRLREEALGVIYKIMGGKGEKYYLSLLNDSDIGVQKRAIQCLGRIKSKTALEKFLEMLKRTEDSPADINPQIEACLFSVLGFYGNLEHPEKGSLEDFLLETLNRQLTSGPLKFLKKKKASPSAGVIAAICESLGEIGTVKSQAILQKLEKQDNRQWKENAKEALTKIAQRQ